MRNNKTKMSLSLAAAFAALGLSGQAAAVDWVMAQAMEPPSTTHKFFGIGQISYSNYYGCDKMQGLVNPGNGSTTTAHALLNGSYNAMCRTGPELRDQKADFNLDNLLVSVGLCLALGVRLATILEALRTAVGAPGRLERVQAPRGPAVFVDYAHTPDAVARALEALRPACRGAQCVVLGCGGDRDPSKRPRMGQLAAEHADHFVATSDNPRTEEPRAIIDQMIAGVPAERRARLHVEVDRRRAIAHAIAAAADDDIILIAGKGHEDYQILGTTKVHLDDREEAARALGLR